MREAGTVRRLSVAVLLDGTYSAGPSGEKVYTPRSREEIASIESLVRSAVGFDEARGDTVEIINMQFAQEALDEIPFDSPGILDGLSFGDFARIAEMLLIGVFGLLALLLVVRPVLQGLAGGATTGRLHGSAGQEQIQNKSSEQLALENSKLNPVPVHSSTANEELEQMIGLKNVEGSIRATSLNKIGEIVNGSPEAAVTVLRNWLNDDV